MLNKLLLIGRMTAEPKTGGNSPLNYAFFTIALNNKYRDKNGAVQEHTEYINISCFGKTADIVSEYATKGDLVFIEGNIVSRNINTNGIKMQKIEVHGNKVRILNSPRRNDIPENNNMQDDYPD